MTPSRPNRLRLADAPDEVRSTATLVASLSSRINMLTMISGASAIGSLMAGFAALGRRVSGTAEGARLRRALEAGRPGQNLSRLWSTLRLDTWATGTAPTPVIDHLRNDLALLLAGDLDEALALLPIPGQPAGVAETADEDPATGLDCVIGLWFYSREIIRGIDALAAPLLEDAAEVIPSTDPRREPPGPLLR